MCQWTCKTLPVVLCHLEWHVECLQSSSSLILFISPFPSNMVSALETASVAAESSPLVISSSWCGYNYKCCTESLGNLASKHGITLIPGYTPTHLNVEANNLSAGRLFPEWHLHQIFLAVFQLLGQPEHESVCILMYQSMSTLLHLGKSTTSGSLGVEYFQQSLDIWGELYFLLYLSSTSSVQVSVEYVTGQFRLLI